MSKLRTNARDQSCLVRVPGVCNFDPATTVGAHFRLSGISGMGLKSPDWLLAFSCSACHAWIDSHKDPETQLMFACGVFRTIAKQIELGALKWQS